MREQVVCVDCECWGYWGARPPVVTPVARHAHYLPQLHHFSPYFSSFTPTPPPLDPNRYGDFDIIYFLGRPTRYYTLLSRWEGRRGFRVERYWAPKSELLEAGK